MLHFPPVSQTKTKKDEAKGSLGPVIIWVGVTPGFTSPDTAHDVSQEILALLPPAEEWS